MYHISIMFTPSGSQFVGGIYMYINIYTIWALCYFCCHIRNMICNVILLI